MKWGGNCEVKSCYCGSMKQGGAVNEVNRIGRRK